MQTEPSLAPERLEDRKAACKTFIEQTKLLMSLASAFIVAPAVAKTLLELPLTGVVLFAEALFVLSVLASYVALGAVSGTQNKGEYDVYRGAIKWAGRVQFLAYVGGIALFSSWLFSQAA